MAVLQQPFNAMQYNPEMGAPSLPLGLKMPVRIISSEVKSAAQNQNNGMVSFMVEVLDGENKGATGAINFNIYNSNGDAARIAHDHLAAMSYVIGVLTWQNTEQLHNIPFLVDVTKQKVKTGQEDKGYVEVSAYYDVQGNKPKRGQVPGGQQQVPQNQGGNGGNGGNAGWNTGGGQQNNQGQQTQDPNQGQQQNQNYNGGNGQQPDQNQQQQNGGYNGGNQQQQNNQQQQGGNAGWNNGGGQQGGNGGGGGAAPWAKQ